MTITTQKIRASNGKEYVAVFINGKEVKDAADLVTKIDPIKV